MASTKKIFSPKYHERWSRRLLYRKTSPGCLFWMINFYYFEKDTDASFTLILLHCDSWLEYAVKVKIVPKERERERERKGRWMRGMPCMAGLGLATILHHVTILNIQAQPRAQHFGSPSALSQPLNSSPSISFPSLSTCISRLLFERLSETI